METQVPRGLEIIRGCQGLNEYMRAQLAKAGIPGPKAIGIDEISIRKGHTYRIVVSDLLRRRLLSAPVALSRYKAPSHARESGSAKAFPTEHIQAYGAGPGESEVAVEDQQLARMLRALDMPRELAGTLAGWERVGQPAA